MGAGVGLGVCVEAVAFGGVASGTACARRSSLDALARDATSSEAAAGTENAKQSVPEARPSHVRVGRQPKSTRSFRSVPKKSPTVSRQLPHSSHHLQRALLAPPGASEVCDASR